MKDRRVCEVFNTLFRPGQISVVLFNVSQFPLTIFNSTPRGSLATFYITTPLVLRIKIFSHTIAMIKNAVEEKALKCTCSYSTKTLFGYTLQKVSKAWTVVVDAVNLFLLAKLVSPYILFDLKKKLFFVLSK